MTDPIKRSETSHICETNRTAHGSVQWFAENRNKKGGASHPITHNNKLQLFICGEEGFGDIAAQIANAKESIDLVCWGFDPGMELTRTGKTWPRGPTYGDLLIAAARRGVRVRLLVWWDYLGGKKQMNMPGYTHDDSPWNSDRVEPENISAADSLARRQAAQKDPGFFRPLRSENIHSDARTEYCWRWYKAAMHGLLGGIEVRRRNGNAGAINDALSSETRGPGRLRDGELEGTLMVGFGTHHQKPVLIDYAYNEGEKAVGYVMGLNSVTDYWCTTSHLLEDFRRERGGEKERKEAVQLNAVDGTAASNPDKGYRTLRPYQDYACRIEGAALHCLYKNFVTAWDRAIDDRAKSAERACTSRENCNSPPARLGRPAQPGDSSVQIVRTQPEEDGDKTIKEVYFQATDIAALGGGYLYLENQYFQYEDWSQRLIEKRKSVIDAWNKGRAKAGKGMEEMPLMHVFIVIPAPELPEMVPRTYDSLAVLGQQDGMTGQSKLIKDTNENPKRMIVADPNGFAHDVGPAPPPAVVKHANTISKPSIEKLEKTYGLKVATAMLQTSAVNRGYWRYREIYIHSKLLLVDDSFFTLGSANLNQRSMAVDSEINIASDDPRHATELRQRIFSMHSGGVVNGGDGSVKDIATAFKDWSDLMLNNNRMKKDRKGMTGFLLPLADNRSTTTRYG